MLNNIYFITALEARSSRSGLVSDEASPWLLLCARTPGVSYSGPSPVALGKQVLKWGVGRGERQGEGAEAERIEEKVKKEKERSEKKGETQRRESTLWEPRERKLH